MATILDRRRAFEIAQAVKRAQRKDEGDIFADIARSSAGRLVPTPRPHPFRDSTRFTYSGELARIAKARRVPAYDQLALGQPIRNLSRLANLQTAYGKPLNIYASYSPKHSADSQHKLGNAFDVNLSMSIPERERFFEAATQMGFTGTGSYDKNKRGVANPGVHIDTRTAATGPVFANGTMQWGGWTKRTGSLPAPAWHTAAVARGLAAGEPDMEAIAAKVAAGSPSFTRSNPYRRRP